MINPTIYSFCDYGYRRKAENWIHYLHEAGLTSFKIICHDEKTFSFLRDKYEPHLINNPDYYFPRIRRRLKQYWQHRKEIFYDLVEEGDCIFSDIDAIFQRDPLPLIEGYALNHDLLFSKVVHAAAHPRPIRKRRGFVICMGWWVIKSSPSSLRLLSQLKKHKIRDDQVSMNNILLGKKGTVTNQESFFSFQHQDLSIGVLPRAIVNRPKSKGQLKDACVEHPVNGKLRAYNLWAI